MGLSITSPAPGYPLPLSILGLSIAPTPGYPLPLSILGLSITPLAPWCPLSLSGEEEPQASLLSRV